MKIFNKDLEKILIFGIKIGIFLILLTPLVFTQKSVFPTVVPKTIYFRILVEIIFFLYILLLLTAQNWRVKYLPEISSIFISLLIFIVILSLSTLKSINPLRSFWGTIERMEGFITISHLFIFFLILTSVFKNKKDWLSLLRFTVLLSIPVGITGIIQKMGIFHFYGLPGEPRISATFGNPVFYGSYLLLIIFLAIFLGIFEEKKEFKILFWLITIFNSILLLFTGTRGAWFGMISGIFLLSIWFLFFSKFQEEKRKAFLFSIFLLFLFFLFFLLFSKLGYLPKTIFLERYESLFTQLIAFKSSRFFVWKLGIDIWKKNPIFGFGLESFSYLYDRNSQASFIKEIPEDMFFDRAHNKIVDTLVSNGLLGLISYLAIFISAVVLIFKYREKYSSLLSFILVSLLFAYFVQNFFAFDTISSYLIFFLSLGFINVNFKKGQFQEISTSSTNHFEIVKDKSSQSFFFGKIMIALLVFFLVTYTIFIVNIRPLLASIRLAEGRELLAKGEIKRAIESFEKSFNLPDFTNFETHFYSAALLFNAQTQSQNQIWQKEFSQEFQKLTKPLEEHLEGKVEIKQMSSYLLLAQIYRALYFIENNFKFLEDEERILGKALKLNPQFPKIYRLAGEMRFLQKREEEGMIFFSKAYELDKNYLAFNEWVGNSLLEAGEKRRGIEILRKALKMSDFYTKEKFNLEMVWKLAQVYEELGDFQEMAKFYEEIILRYPKEFSIHPQIFASLATAYAKIEEKEKARQTIERMLKLYPQLRTQAEEFLSTLE